MTSPRRNGHGKRRDLHRLADVGDVLSEIDRQIADLQQRVNALLDGQTI